MPQNDDIKIESRETWSSPSNIKLLKVAGLFDEWMNEDGDRIYSYTVITFESNTKMSWMHHRMPAILETDKQVSDWLDFERIPSQKALALLTPATDFTWHRVSSLVNNSRNKSDRCNKSLTDIKNAPKNKMMESWLIKKPNFKSQLNNDEADILAESSENQPKKIKLEH